MSKRVAGCDRVRTGVVLALFAYCCISGCDQPRLQQGTNAATVPEVTAHERLDGHEGVVYRIALSPCGKLLASAGEDKTVRVWDVVGRKLRHTLRGHSEPVYAVAFSGEGDWLVSAGRDKTVRVWDLKNDGAERETLRGHDAAVTACSFSGDGKRLATTGEGSIRVWSFSPQDKSSESVIEFSDHYGPRKIRLAAARFLPGDQQIVSGSGFELALWDVAAGKRADENFSRFNGKIVNSIAISTDGTMLAVCGWKDSKPGRINVWKLGTRELVADIEIPVRVLCVAFRPDGKVLAGSRIDRTISLWEVSTGKEISRLVGHTAEGVTGVAFTADGKTLASCGEDGSVRLWDVSAKE